jgi:hypothetical protein
MTRDELDRFGAAEEIELAPVESDDASRRAVVIWIVRLGDDLYVRSAYGRGSAWFRAVQTQHQRSNLVQSHRKRPDFSTRRQEPQTRRSMPVTVANTTATERSTST